MWKLQITDFFQSIAVQTLVYEAYSRYGFLSTGQIERMRLKHRLRVVQELEDNSERNIIRSVSADNYFTTAEIQVNLTIQNPVSFFSNA